MEPDIPDRLDKIELKLSEHDEKIIAHDRTLTAIRNLLQTGIRMLVNMESKMAETDKKIAALADSETRLYGTMQQLAEAQKRTEESLKRFLDRSGNGRGQ